MEESRILGAIAGTYITGFGTCLVGAVAGFLSGMMMCGLEGAVLGWKAGASIGLCCGLMDGPFFGRIAGAAVITAGILGGGWVAEQRGGIVGGMLAGLVIGCLRMGASPSGRPLKEQIFLGVGIGAAAGMAGWVIDDWLTSLTF